MILKLPNSTIRYVYDDNNTIMGIMGRVDELMHMGILDRVVSQQHFGCFYMIKITVERLYLQKVEKNY